MMTSSIKQGCWSLPKMSVGVLSILLVAWVLNKTKGGVAIILLH